VVAPSWELATKKKALSIVVSPVPPIADLASVDVATLLKKTKKNTRGDDDFAKQIGMEAVLFR
jgi:hypothetical protein